MRIISYNIIIGVFIWLIKGLSSSFILTNILKYYTRLKDSSIIAIANFTLLENRIL